MHACKSLGSRDLSRDYSRICLRARRNISWRRISVDDDRVDAVISHLEDMNSTLKSLRSEGGELEPYVGSVEVLPCARPHTVNFQACHIPQQQKTGSMFLDTVNLALFVAVCSRATGKHDRPDETS